MPFYTVTIDATIIVRVEVPPGEDEENAAGELAMETLDKLETENITVASLTCSDTELAPPAV